MPNFDWQLTQTNPLGRRFVDSSIGWPHWNRLVGDLFNLGTGPSPDACQRVFDVFLQGVAVAAANVPAPLECRVFVSHRGTARDTAFAERIAFLAVNAGYEYWLDIHDPTLHFINTSPLIQSPTRDVLIAAIIEMGLLNASHVIAVMTDDSAGSKWIPYEFGRAKQRLIVSSRSAIWLEPTMQASACGEYVHLGVMNGNETDIKRWLGAKSQPYCAPSTSKIWPKPDEPAPLP